MSSNEDEGSSLSSRVDQLNDIPAEKLEQAKSVAQGIEQLKDGNAMYQRCFQILKLGRLEAEMPRLVVFGQQSMGKTTLLDLIMGGPIGYSSTDTGTKQPVVIMLKPTTNPVTSALSSDDAIECTVRGKTVAIRELQKMMHEIMTSAPGISAEELEIEIALPEGVHAVFVDLPGIKDDSKEGAELTRNVVRTYVQNNPNDLYILVKKASDDPANWPYTLREFILSAQPKGLGLKPKQTVVVGTRARDFLRGETNDVRKLSELEQRVRKRAVKDHEGNALPLFLLELFSLSITDKDEADFGKRKARMDEQITAGREECFKLLREAFIADRVKPADLEKIFDTQHFSKELNRKFQLLLSDQLGILEYRLTQKRSEVMKKLRAKENDLINVGSATVRESIHSFVGSLSRIVNDLVTGNFEIMRLPDGDKWLAENGGTLADNLQDGHQLAMELWPDENEYSPNFLDKMNELAERAVKKMSQRSVNERRWRQRVMETLALQKKEADGKKADEMANDNLKGDSGIEAEFRKTDSLVYRSNLKVNMPIPDRGGALFPGQFVRFTIRDGSQMLGYVMSLEDDNASVSFSFKQNAPGQSGEQERVAERAKLEVIIPLPMIMNTTIQATPFLAWHQTFRADGWKIVEAVSVREIKNLHPIANPWTSDASSHVGQTTLYDGIAVINPVTTPDIRSITTAMRDPNPDPVTARNAMQSLTIDEKQTREVPLMELFLDSAVVNQEYGIWNSATTLQRIAGEYAETKLLNQLSLTYLGRWMKFHIAHLEATRRISENELLQMMRTLKNVIDKADWEPVVADLLQSNVREGILQLARLAACSTSVALRRILRAGFAEIQRKAERQELQTPFVFLLKSPRFVTECEAAMESYCRDRAKQCADEMAAIIFDQTHAIHFEMIADIFDGCRQFEAEFLGTNSLCGITDEVNRKLQARKGELSRADVYSHGAQALQSQAMIYEEVRVHFWVVKMLLAAPMTTKLYISFVKDIKDRTQHLASRNPQSDDRSILEKTLFQTFLYETNSEAILRQRSEKALIEYYDFNVSSKYLQEQIDCLQRAAEYMKLTLNCVSKLRSLMKQGHEVDFLKRLGNMQFPGQPPRRGSAITSPPMGMTSAKSASKMNYAPRTYGHVMDDTSHTPFPPSSTPETLLLTPNKPKAQVAGAYQKNLYDVHVHGGPLSTVKTPQTGPYEAAPVWDTATQSY